MVWLLCHLYVDNIFATKNKNSKATQNTKQTKKKNNKQNILVGIYYFFHFTFIFYWLNVMHLKARSNQTNIISKTKTFSLKIFSTLNRKKKNGWSEKISNKKNRMKWSYWRWYESIHSTMECVRYKYWEKRAKMLKEKRRGKKTKQKKFLFYFFFHSNFLLTCKNLSYFILK